MEKSKTTFEINGGGGKFYSIQDLIFFLENINNTRSKYVIQCNTLNIRPISMSDQQPLKKYFIKKKRKDLLNIDPRNLQNQLIKPNNSGQKLDLEKNFLNEIKSETKDFSTKIEKCIVNYKQQEKLLKSRLTLLRSNKKKSIIFEKNKLYSKIKFSYKDRKHQINGYRNFLQKRIKTEIPVIVVPSAVSSIINIRNAKNFFEKCEYIPHEKSPKIKIGEKILIEKPSKLYPNETAIYEIIDDPIKLPNIEDWNRIVAVISVGKQWQFTRWKRNYNSPQDLFNRCIGFFFYFDDNPLARIKLPVVNWRVKLLPISKIERHNDDQVVVNFWNILYEFLPSHNNKKLKY